MTDDRQIIGRPYQDLYAGYYSNPTGLGQKRGISAAQSVGCLIEALGDAEPPVSLLDVGAGDGNVLAELDARRLSPELHAVEVSASGLEAIRARKLSLLRDAKIFDGYKIPYPDKYFELSIAIHVLEHVEHERLFLQEIRRISQRAFIEVPLEHGFRIQRSIDRGKKFGHINFYTRQTLLSLLQSSGLTVISSKVVPSSLEYEQHLSGKMKGSVKNFLRRSALAAAPNTAPWFMVYNAYAYCECT